MLCCSGERYRAMMALLFSVLISISLSFNSMFSLGKLNCLASFQLIYFIALLVIVLKVSELPLNLVSLHVYSASCLLKLSASFDFKSYSYSSTLLLFNPVIPVEKE